MMLLKLLPIGFLFKGLGISGLGPPSMTVAKTGLSLRRKDGVAKRTRQKDGVPSSSLFLFIGVTKLSSKNLLLLDAGVRLPLAAISTSELFVSFSNLLGVATILF